MILILLLFYVDTSLSLATESIRYSYDALGRITSAEYVAKGSISYSHDEAGNITSFSFIRNNSGAGDLNGDGSLTIVDVVLGLQMLAGLRPSSANVSNADINSDDKIGMEEILFVLDKAATY